MNLSKLGVWYHFDHMSAADTAAAAQRIEKLGYSALWIPEAMGRNSLVHAGWLLANTSSLVLATGITSIYNREPGVAMQAKQTLAEQSGNRFILGMGVSHRPLVEGVRALDYGPPLKTMRTYLEAIKASPYHGPEPSEEAPIVIAALGPKMLELAATHCSGAHPYFVSPEHTARARSIMGNGPKLYVEQKVILEEDADKARQVARANAAQYLSLPNYCNSWLRMGLTQDDLENGGSDKFIDTTYAWGSLSVIKDRLQQHYDAGADQVCIQPVNPDSQDKRIHWDVLEALI